MTIFAKVTQFLRLGRVGILVAAADTQEEAQAAIGNSGGPGGSSAWGGITGTLSNQTDLQTALNLKAPLVSPTFTGTVTMPTASPGTNTTQGATTAFVRTEVAALVASAPGTLDTLDELAAALGDNANFAATVASSLATKTPLGTTLKWLGQYDPEHQYAINDCVYHGGASFVAIEVPPTGESYPVSDFWKSISSEVPQPIALGNVAWIETTGNDTTGVIGNPAFPYETMQAAYDAGARTLYLGEGEFAGINNDTVQVSLFGRGGDLTQVTLIVADDLESVNITDIGKHSVYVTNVICRGGSIALDNVNAGTVDASGQDGLNEGDLEIDSSATHGMAGGNVTLLGSCKVATTLTVNGGNGGNSGNVDSAGNGGNGGVLTAYFGPNRVEELNLSGGNGGAGEADWPSGDGADAGNCYLVNTTVNSYAAIFHGMEGDEVGGGGLGARGTYPIALTFKNCVIETLGLSDEGQIPILTLINSHIVYSNDGTFEFSGTASSTTQSQFRTGKFELVVPDPADNSDVRVFVDAKIINVRFGGDNPEFVMLRVDPPATASSTGRAGMFAYSSSHFYVCTATNTWKRVAIATW